MNNIKLFASTEESGGGLLSVLGIDWMMLTFQIIAFLILVWLLGKFVYPWLLKSIDDRQSKIDASVKAVAKAQAETIEAEYRISKMLSDARIEADDIIATAKSESAATLASVEEKSKKRADQIINDAHEQIDKDVIAAKKKLRDETIELVALATEKVIGKVVSKSVDNDLIKKSIEGLK